MKNIGFMKYLKDKRISLTAAVLIASIIVTGGFNLAIIITSYLLTDKIFDIKLGSKVFDTKLFRKLTTLILYFIILQCTILMSWLISHNFPLDETPLMTLSILFLVFLQQRYLVKKEPSRKLSLSLPTFKYADIVALLTAAAVIVPIITTPSYIMGYNVSQTARYLAGYNDDMHHYDFVVLRLKYNRGVLYGSDAENERIDNRIASPTYPASWPAANAVVIESFYPKISIGDATVIAYAISKLVWFAIVIYLFTKVIFTIYSAFNNNEKQSATVSILWLSCITLLSCRVYFIDVFIGGFYSFLPQMFAVLLMISLIIQMNDQYKKDRQYQDTLLAMILIAVGGCLPWFLVMPSSCLAIALITCDYIISNGRLKFIDEIIFAFKKYWPFYSLLVVSVGVQSFLSLPHDDVSGSLSFVDAMLNDGNFYASRPEFYAFMGIGCILCLIFINPKFKRALRYMTYAFLSILILAGIISAIQKGIIHRNTYYYYKVLYAATLISLPLGIVGVSLGLDWIEKHRSKSLAVTMFFILLILFLQTFNLHL